MKFPANQARVFLTISILFLYVTAELQGPVVHTKLGRLKGKYVSVKGKETGVHAYLGVPFAKPPVGPLRLAPPQPTEGWEGVRDATQQPLMCVQDQWVTAELARNFSLQVEFPDISEDCLYLNIYTPVEPSENRKLPVMVWIHGGGLTIGSASSYDGSALAAYQDVVVVLIQYRLGILGFISTGDKNMPGNIGLLDQVEALRWVQEHIHNFGGDPGSVTIFGESAGGVSTSVLLLSPLSAGLFHGAIAESGSAEMEQLMNLNPLPIAQTIANLSGCDSSTTERIAECVMKMSVEDILKIHKENQFLQLGVTVDGTFLLKSTTELLQNHESHNVPFMIGCNSDEAGWIFPNILAPPGWVDGMDREVATSIMAMLLYPDPKDQWISELVADEYMGTSGDREKIRDGLNELIGDVIFIMPSLKTANFHRDAGAPVYFYLFQESPSMLKKKRPSFVGSDHADEVLFVLGFCFAEDQVKLSEPCTEEDEELSRTMMTYWGNFARTRSPNGPGLVQWPQYGAEGDYLAIGMEQVPGQHLKKDRFTFITQTLPEEIQRHKEKMEHKKLLKTEPVVHTKLGSLRGQYVSVKGKETVVHAYLGVPFAKPPVGPLRLAPPQPTEGWEGVRDATQQPLMCVQNKQMLVYLIKMLDNFTVDIPDVSEDCLYLNIYTPANAAQDAKLPVMVWIHGGGLTSGSASVYDGSALAAYQDVVVVLVQYRLGLLGFLSTGDEHISGNFGLLDQVEALRWVQEHIHIFGGDPSSVTIFGESAGGVSVSLLLLSPLSDGLFHHAIAESGTAAMDALLTNDPLQFAQVVANASDCGITSTEKFTECMKYMDTDAMATLGQDNMMRFPVTVDGHFLTKPVDELFQSHKLLKIPFITGVNNDEGGWLLPGFFAPPNWTEGMDREYIMTTLAMFFPDSKDELIRELLADEYLGTSGDPVKNRDGFTELIGDLMFLLPAIKTANAHRDAGAPVYLYEYQHPPKFLQEKRPSFVRSDHGDELFTVLGFCFTTTHVKLGGLQLKLDPTTTILDVCTEEEKQLSRTMMSYWGNFARTGSPNGPSLVQWPQYGAEGDYLGIGLEQVPGQHLKKDRFTFISQTLPEEIQRHKEKMEHKEPLKTEPVVHTKLGSLRGQYVSVKGKDTGVHAYLGVPFAKPPVGPLRLAPPQPTEGWEGVRDATQQPLMCVQNKQMLVDLMKKFGYIIVDIPDVSEDCLYLNIYTPANAAQDAKLPVMVWIHGGGLTSGSASVYDGSALAAYQDVVVVLVQYRLGLLGFLSTGDEHISGNFGLLDQVEALRWVQEHIHNFGGDPSSVTIFGESAGGASVSLLLLSPLSDGLFHHAIAESGTAAMDQLLTNDPLQFAQVVANASDCGITSTEKFTECMRYMDTDAMATLGQDLMMRFPVTVDGHFLTKPVDELYQSHELLKIPFITGVNNDEAGWLLPGFFAPPNWTEGMDREYIMTTLAMFFPDPKDELIRELLADEYLGTSGDPVKNRDGFTELIGDLMFLLPAIKTANAHRDAGAPVYLYEYQHPPKFLQEKRPSFVRSDHGDELFTVLGFCFTTTHVKLGGLQLKLDPTTTILDVCTEEEKQLSRTMMSYWGNFARTGSPNGPSLVQWPQYGAEGDYLGIGLEQVPGQHLKKDRFTFISQTLPEEIQRHKEKMEHSEL